MSQNCFFKYFENLILAREIKYVKIELGKHYKIDHYL